MVLLFNRIYKERIYKEHNMDQQEAKSEQSMSSGNGKITIDMQNRIMFGPNWQTMSEEEKDRIFQESLKFKCLD